MVKVNINEIKQNPFKKFINGGKLEEERIDKLVESIEHGTLQPNFVARKNDNGKWEISSGHHRLAAFRKKFGKDFKVDISEAKFSDEQMLVDMVRENLTQRGEGSFRDTEESIVLARQWVLSKSRNAKQFGNRLRDSKGHFKGSQPVNGSARSIAEFLSKNGKAVSREMVRQYLNIHDKLDGNLKKKLENLEQKKDGEKEEKMGIRVAIRLTTLEDKEKQREAWQRINELELNSKNAEKLITQMKNEKVMIPQVLTKHEFEEEDNIQKRILFKEHWDRVRDGYHTDLIQWINYSKHLSKPELKKLFVEIKDIQKQEEKLIKKLTEVKN